MLGYLRIDFLRGMNEVMWVIAHGRVKCLVN